MKRTGRVERFRSIEAMDAAGPPTASPAPADFARFLRQCARMRALSGRRFPRGVFRFRGVDDEHRGREQTPTGT